MTYMSAADLMMTECRHNGIRTNTYYDGSVTRHQPPLPLHTTGGDGARITHNTIVIGHTLLLQIWTPSPFCSNKIFFWRLIQKASMAFQLFLVENLHTMKLFHTKATFDFLSKVASEHCRCFWLFSLAVICILKGLFLAHVLNGQPPAAEFNCHPRHCTAGRPSQCGERGGDSELN